MVRDTKHDRAAVERAAAEIRRLARPLSEAADLDPLMERIGGARCVLLGEATHGTSEFYTWRAAITRRLVAEEGFRIIAVEGDWPDCARVNRFIKHGGGHRSALEALHAFNRWPTWMWANEEAAELVEWLREHNRGRAPADRAGFFGLDVYSLFESMDAVVRYLAAHDPGLLPAAKAAYACFDAFGRDERGYARATALAPATCEDEVVSVLTELRRRAPAPPDGDEALLHAEQNAVIAVNAERYYRTMVRADESSWNIRDIHMADTLDRLLEFHGPRSRAVVWAHNTHIGDARETDMADSGMTNLGQLVRERHAGEGVVLVGFSTWRGSVIAARGWGEDMEEMSVPPARPGSWDDALHASTGGDALVVFDAARRLRALGEPLGQRAVGVVYHPRSEAAGNYVPTALARRYDALLHIDRSTAVRPLHMRPRGNLIPETFPSGA